MSDRPGPDQTAVSGSANFALLEQTLWQQFRAADSRESFARHWLTLQCRYLRGAQAGVLVLGEPGSGHFTPAARWPDNSATAPSLAATAERALEEQRSVVSEDANRHVAIPIFVGELVYGVAALTLDTGVDPRAAIWQLNWGAAWIEAMFRRQQNADDANLHDRNRLAFDLIASVLEQEGFPSACQALAMELAHALDCDPVAIGVLENERVRLTAISHSSQFGEKMKLVRELEAAMLEAADQSTIVMYPAPADWDFRVSRLHEELATAQRAGSVLTIPLRGGTQGTGVITLLRAEPFTDDEVAVLDSALGAIGPILQLQQLEDRSLWRKIGAACSEQVQRLLGPHYIGRKLAAFSVLTVVLLLTLITGEYRVTSPALVEGLVQRSVVAPFDGYIDTQHARAGEEVAAGQLLATLNDQDLALERIRWSTRSRQNAAEYDQALARRERAEANIIRTQMEQAQAQVALLDKQLERTRILAPFDAMVVSGDLSQLVGAAVRRGDELFRLAPLREHRLILEVDEGDVADLQVGQQGDLRLASHPGETLTYEVTLITSIAQQGEGRNYFRVEAVLKDPDISLRPGMEGIAKTNVEDRLVIRIWSEKLVDWLRLSLWAWWP